MFMSDLPIIELKQTDPCFS